MLLGAGCLAGFGSPASASSGEAAPPVPSRGFNLPGWVDRETEWVAPARSVLDKLHRLGFRTVRLPVAADPIIATGRTGILGRIRDAVPMLIAAGFSVTVDLHPAGRFAALFRDDPEAAAGIAAAAWERLCPIIAEFPPDRVYAELLNEPPLTREAWLALRERLAALVRLGCPRHTIVWGPARFQGIWEIVNTPPLADRNTIAAVHYYTPMGFTHQCENWDSSPLGRLGHLPFPADRDGPEYRTLAGRLGKEGDREALAFLEGEFSHPWTTASIEEDFAGLGRWSKRHGCPVILNEFGVLGFCVDPASRATWIRAVRQAAEANDVGWTYWEVDHGFGFIEDRRSTDGFDLAIIETLTGADG